MSAAPQLEEASTAKGTGRALVPFVATAQKAAGAWTPMQAALLIACFGLALGAGGGTIYGLRHVLPWPHAAQPAVPTAMMHRLEDQVGKLQQSLDALRATADSSRPDEPLRGIKRSVEALRQDIDQVRSNSAANVAQLSAKIDKTEHDPNPKLVEIAARLDRIEKQAAPNPTTGAIPVAARVPPVPAASVKPVAAVAAQPAPKPVAAAAAQPPAAKSAPVASVPQPVAKPVAAAAAAARTESTQVAATPPASLRNSPATVAGWALRDVYDGMALVEARNGGLREIQPGQYLPGAGQIRSIERRGRAWVVLTSRGVIQNTTF